MDNNLYYGVPAGQDIYGGTMPVYGQPMYYNPVPQPQNKPSLTVEEMKMIQQTNPSKIDITISQADNLRAVCNHKDHMQNDRVQQVTDGTGDVWCPICNKRWSPENASKQEVKEICDKLISFMQNAKWVGDYGTELVRDYFAMIPLLEKFPDLYEYAMNQFNRYCNTNGYTNANEAAIYNQYNSLMSYANQQYAPSYGYAPQQPVGYYGQQPQMMQQQPVYNKPATTVNPMQAQAPMYAQPQQMNPYTYQAPMAPTPGVGAPLGTMPAPNYAPVGAQQEAQTATAQPAEGTVATSENTVKLS